MISARGRIVNCTGDADADSSRAWQVLQEGVRKASALGMTALVDSYRCTSAPWGGAANFGGSQQHVANAFIERQERHKATVRELEWLATRVAGDPSVVGLLVTDDAVDLAQEDLDSIAWMREHTPQLWPWLNQCSDGTEWLARAGTPYAGGNRVCIHEYAYSPATPLGV